VQSQNVDSFLKLFEILSYRRPFLSRNVKAFFGEVQHLNELLHFSPLFGTAGFKHEFPDKLNRLLAADLG
jgi:hypothetical protein